MVMRKFWILPWPKLAVVAGLSVIGGIAILGADIYTFAAKSDSSPADAAVVLGAAVWNEEPSPVFAERINHAIYLYQTGAVKFIIFTGGVGAGDQFAESTIASQYAIAKGVAAQDTLCETSSRITQENLQGAKQLIDQYQLGRILIVSDPLHMRRSIMMARDSGIDAYPAPTPTTRYISFRSQLEFLLREIFFYGLYLVQRPFDMLIEPSQPMKVQPCQKTPAG